MIFRDEHCAGRSLIGDPSRRQAESTIATRLCRRDLAVATIVVRIAQDAWHPRTSAMNAL